MLKFLDVNCFRRFLGYISLSFMLLVIACQSNQSDKSKKSEEATAIQKDLSDQLSAGADIETIARHLIQVRKEAGVTRALALHYPDLDEDAAYKIQMKMLSILEKQGEKLAGWKMGGSQVTDPAKPFHPVFGFMLASGGFQSGSMANSARFTGGSPLVEAEVGFVLKKDLPGANNSREDIIDAVGGVGGFSELISGRIKDANGGNKAATALSIADGLANGGFVRPQKTKALGEVDLKTIKARVVINGETKAEGDTKDFAFIDAVRYLANTLPKYGRHLRAGDIIITGSVLTPPPAKAGDKVKIIFSDFEPLSIEFK